MPSNHLNLCRSLLPPSIFPIIRVFSNESLLHIRWPKYWSFSFSISPSNDYSELISFWFDWLDLLAIQGTLKSLLQHHSSKASILWCSTFFIVQLSHPYVTTGKIIALTRCTFVGKVMSLIFNMLSMLVRTFLWRNKCLLISWLQSLPWFCEVAQSCLTLCNPMDCSTRGSPVHHQLLELAQIHVYWVGNAIQPSCPLSSPSPPAFNLSQHQGLFNELTLHIRWPKCWIFSSNSISVLPMNIQDWFPLGLTDLISCCPRDSQESSPTPQFRSINSSVLSYLYGPTLTFIHKYWKNHGFD